MLRLEITIAGEVFDVAYPTLDSAMEDRALNAALDAGAATCRLWCGELLLTGRPIESARDLRAAVVENSRTILRAAGV